MYYSDGDGRAKGINSRTERPRRLLIRPQREEGPPGRLEEEVALERGHALVHRRTYVIVPCAEGRALCGVVGIEREEGLDFVARRPREEVLAHVLEELVVCAVCWMGGGVSGSGETMQGFEKGRGGGAYVMFQAPPATTVASSNEPPAWSVRRRL